MGIQILNQWLQTEAKQQTPTLIMMDSNLHHPRSPPRKRYYQGMWEEKLLPCFTKTHPNILRSGRQTHNNRPHLGESHHPKCSTGDTSKTEQPLLGPPSHNNKNNSS
ncbi:hypothetical protein O181_104405 [Austropuccinia psidii MF-1]|uniref:Uncharacterized protein n=1 Tax=Austropuccinia psidii MF-1 TaxID=1389203 RepID=A0A9Q3JJV2_9BASI|nr:hypothetical protein [Austropuccinia psidii MF-1]